MAESEYLMNFHVFFSENIQWQRNRIVQLEGTFKENWAQLFDRFRANQMLKLIVEGIAQVAQH